MGNLLFEEETYKIRGCVYTVHNELGCGFLEKVYQASLEREFEKSSIPFKREYKLPIYYKGEPLNLDYIADFICYDKIILELKAVSKLTEIHVAQLLNYLKATRLKLGLLINFGEESVRIERVINY